MDASAHCGTPREAARHRSWNATCATTPARAAAGAARPIPTPRANPLLPSSQVRLTNHGLDLIEVADNGAGIPPASRAALGRPHHTSKLASVADLDALASFGFRGEALASLAALADVTVVTRTAAEEVATKLALDPKGGPPTSAPAARAVGTTVSAARVFAGLPVRRRELERAARREFARALAVLQAYALISTGARVVATDQTPGGARTTLVATVAGAGLAANAVAVLGARPAAALVPFDAPLLGGARVVGLLSAASAPRPRSGADRQFFYVNGRPVDAPRAARALNDAWRSLGSPATAASRPAAVLDFRLPPAWVDVNVTPDKRKVLVRGEDALLAGLGEAVAAAWEPSRSTYRVDASLAPSAAPSGKRRRQEEAEEEEEEEEEEEAGTTPTPAPLLSPPPQRRSTKSAAPLDLASFAMGARGADRGAAPAAAAAARGCGRGRGAPPASQPSLAAFVTRTARVSPAAAAERPASEAAERAAGSPSLQPQPPARRSSRATPAEPSASVSTSEPMSEDEEEEDAAAAREPSAAPEPSPGPAAPSPAPTPAPPRTVPPPESTLTVDLDALRAAAVAKAASRAAAAAAAVARRPPPRAAAYVAASLAGEAGGAGDAEPAPPPLTAGSPPPAPPDGAPADAAAAELERHFKRDDFAALARGVVGQFNRGFIVARLNDDLFVVDQHASDERANYERLCASTTLQRQPLLAPVPLDLAPDEAAAARDGAAVLAANGFAVADAPDGGGLVLTAVPYTRGDVFGPADVAELAAQLARCGPAARAPGRPPPRPARVRAMLAMRACKASIRIGKPLARAEQAAVVARLATLDAPWSCAHGRPTMRFLHALEPLEK